MDLKKNSVSADEELEKLRYELEAEKQKKSRLGKRIDHLEQTIEHLTKLFEDDVTNDECQKWRTKYEMQAGLNWKLEDDIRTLNRRVIEANQLLYDKNRLKRKFRADGRMQKEEDTVRPYEVKLLEREKLILQGELRNAEHRLDRESQMFYKLDEECRRIERDIGINTYSIIHQLNHSQQLQKPIHRQAKKKQTPLGGPSAFSSSSYVIGPNNQRSTDDVNSGQRHRPLLNDQTRRKKDQRKPTLPTYNY